MRVLLLGVHHGRALRGANVVIRGMARALAARGHEVTLVQAARPADQRPLADVRTEYVPTVRKSVYPLRMALRRLGRFDVVHTHDLAGGGVALRGLFGRLPWVAQVQPPRVHPESLWRSGWRTRYIALSARRAPCVVVPSRWLAEALAARHGIDPARIAVVPCGIGEHWFEASQASVGAPEAGREARVVLVNMKGVRVALEAFARAGWARAARLELYGEARDLEAHRRRAAELGIAERVRFEGFVANEELPARLAGAAMLLHPTEGESFGQVLAEAAALGIPAVASRVGATPEVVEDGRTGFLCPAGDSEAFATALARLLDDAGLRLRMGEAARGRARALWRWQRVAERLENEVYPRVARHRG